MKRFALLCCAALCCTAAVADPLPPDRVLIQWGTNWPSVTIEESTNLIDWQFLDVVTDGRCWETNFVDAARFFRINRRDDLTITAFNPMNLMQGQTLCQTNFVPSPPASGITLSRSDAVSLSWTVTGDIPELLGWLVYSANNDVFFGESLVTGTAPGVHTVTGLTQGLYYRVVRATDDDLPVPPYSNTVFLP